MEFRVPGTFGIPPTSRILPIEGMRTKCEQRSGYKLCVRATLAVQLLCLSGGNSVEKGIQLCYEHNVQIGERVADLWKRWGKLEYAMIFRKIETSDYTL